MKALKALVFALTLVGAAPSAFAYSTATAVIKCNDKESRSYDACNTADTHRIVISNGAENGFQTQARSLGNALCSSLGGVDSIRWEAEDSVRKLYKLY